MIMVTMRPIMSIVASCLALLLIILDNDTTTSTNSSLCMSLSPSPSFPPWRLSNNVVISRRRACFQAVSSCWGITILPVVVVVAASPLTANAACLQGDLSKECIGVYKVPIQWDDETDSKTIENLKKFAPTELNYDSVPRLKRPKSNRVARQTLEQQQTIIQETVLDLVTAGQLEDAGICLLGVIPKVSSAGNFIVQEAMNKKNDNGSDVSSSSSSSSSSTNSIDEIRLMRLQSQYQLLLGLLGQADVSIGQALRGDIPGTITMAQISILSDLKEAISAYDDFLSMIPKDDDSSLSK